MLLAGLASPWSAWANPPIEGMGSASRQADWQFRKRIDSPNPIELRRIKQRLEWQQAQRQARLNGASDSVSSSAMNGFVKSGTDRVLIILVEFAGTNQFTWTPGSSTWDPLGRCDNSEFDGTHTENAAASQFFADKHGITGPTNLTYAGPLHNEIPRPLGTNDASAAMIWMPDFSPSYYSNIVFGNGITFDFTRQDGSVVYEDYPGKSVRDYYEDVSGGAYSFTGAVLGWVSVSNSVWYYGGDGLPGARSCPERPSDSGAIPGGGNALTLVVDAINAAKAAYPTFNWAYYDQDGDGYLDHLWIIHAGLGEEDSPIVLNRTSYGEGGIWSHSSELATPYQVVPGVSASAYIMMPENSGLGVLAHEFGHNLGADDLYTYGDGETSTGFWTLMADDWVGFPLGFLPQAIDPMHLDQWGWLTPQLISDPTKVYSVKLGQASKFPGAADLVRGVKIELPDQKVPLPVPPRGQFQWWGGNGSLIDGAMRLKQALHIPATGATLEFQTAYDTESGYDYFLVEVSSNAGSTWQTLAQYDGRSTGYPAYKGRTISLSSLANQDILIRFRYTTDASIQGDGPFMDDIFVRAGTEVLLADDAEQERNLWTYTAPWARNDGFSTTGHNYYLQWRNTSASGGYDQGLGDARFRFGPVNSGLLVWYENGRYQDNSIANYLTDSPSFGPKGRLLVVDAHPEPDLDPYWVAQGVANERGIVFSRGSMRDAPFSRWPTFDYRLQPPWAFQAADFAGRPAVGCFSDAAGYYPGLQNLGTNHWRTWQWDASVVLPSTAPYGVRAPGYRAGDSLEMLIATRGYIGTNDLLLYQTNQVNGGLTQPGADGNPGTVNGQYGWNVWIVQQTNAWAEVVIWNSRYADLDDDHDGFPNWQEAIAGTDPKDPGAYLRVTHTERSGADGSVLLEWPSTTNRVYRVLRTGTLPAGFHIIASDLPATPPVNTFRDQSPSPDRQAFYRIEIQ